MRKHLRVRKKYEYLYIYYYYYNNTNITIEHGVILYYTSIHMIVRYTLMMTRTYYIMRGEVSAKYIIILSVRTRI